MSETPEIPETRKASKSSTKKYEKYIQLLRDLSDQVPKGSLRTRAYEAIESMLESIKHGGCNCRKVEAGQVLHQALYNPCVYESGFSVISLHFTEEGAKAAVAAHKLETEKDGVFGWQLWDTKPIVVKT